MSGYKETFERKEVKYLLGWKQYEALRRRLSPYVGEDVYGKTQILNIYFDTPDFRLVRRSLEKPAYKEKLRLRTYRIPDDDTTAFVEIKKKYRGIVYKRRIDMTYRQAIDYLCHGAEAPQRSQISDEIDYFLTFYRQIVPAMKIRYERIAMAGRFDPELRITFDRNLQWSMNLDLQDTEEGVPILDGNQILMELKVQGAIKPAIADILNELAIYPVSFSKYGRGFEMYSQQKKKFDRFYRADSSRSRESGGFGIGLSAARAICRRHGGNIHAVKEGDHSIRFRAQLPG